MKKLESIFLDCKFDSKIWLAESMVSKSSFATLMSIRDFIIPWGNMKHTPAYNISNQLIFF